MWREACRVWSLMTGPHSGARSRAIRNPGEHILTKEFSIGVHTVGFDVDLKGFTEPDERVSPLIAFLGALEQIPWRSGAKRR